MGLRPLNRVVPRIDETPATPLIGAVPARLPLGPGTTEFLGFVAKNAPKPANAPGRVGLPGVLGVGTAVVGVLETVYRLHEGWQAQKENEAAAQEFWRLIQIGIQRIGQTAEQVVAELKEMETLMRRSADLQFQLQQLKRLPGHESEVLRLGEELETLQIQMHTTAKTYPVIGGALKLVASVGGTEEIAAIFETQEFATYDNEAAHLRFDADLDETRQRLVDVAAGTLRYDRLDSLVMALTRGKPATRIVEYGPGLLGDLAVAVARQYPIIAIDEFPRPFKIPLKGLPTALLGRITFHEIDRAPDTLQADLVFWINPDPWVAFPNRVLNIPLLGKTVAAGGYLVIQTEDGVDTRYNETPGWRLVYKGDGLIAPTLLQDYAIQVFVIQRLR